MSITPDHRPSIISYALDKKKRIVSIGMNSYIKTHPTQFKYGKMSGNENKTYIHAELDSLIKAKGKKIHTVIVCRHDRNKVLAIAKPCESCMLALKDYGVEEVYYSTSSGFEHLDI